MMCFFFKRNTEYGVRMSDWRSDVCTSDVDVLLSDIDIARAEAGKWGSAKALVRLRAKENMGQCEGDALLGRITPVAYHSVFAPANLVIEAATEREEIK